MAPTLIARRRRVIVRFLCRRCSTFCNFMTRFNQTVTQRLVITVTWLNHVPIDVARKWWRQEFPAENAIPSNISADIDTLHPDGCSNMFLIRLPFCCCHLDIDGESEGKWSKLIFCCHYVHLLNISARTLSEEKAMSTIQIRHLLLMSNG